MWGLVDLLSGRDGGSDHGEQLQSLHRVQGSQWDIQLQTQLNLVAMKVSPLINLANENIKFLYYFLRVNLLSCSTKFQKSRHISHKVYITNVL